MIHIGDPFLEDGIHKVTVSGYDGLGNLINEEAVEIPISETITPAAVFLWVLKKLKKLDKNDALPPNP